MKFNGKIMSLGALLVAVTACYGQEQRQQVVIENYIPADHMYGGIYLTSLTGKILKGMDVPLNFDNQNPCHQISFLKPTISQQHRIILTADLEESKKISSGTANKSKISSTVIRGSGLPVL